MDITKTIEGTILKLSIKGRLDTTTAPKLQDEISSCLQGINDLQIDMDGLDYVSSAGLRVLLALQKTMNEQGKMVIRNVCDEVMEVFDITGFADILTIEK